MINMGIINGGIAMMKRLKFILGNLKTDKRSLRVGFLETARYPTGMYVAQVAAIQEWGAPKAGIPPRSFFRTMVTAKKGTWGKNFADSLKTTNYDVMKSYGWMGEIIKGQLEGSIVALVDPPLSPTTLMLRKMRQQNPSLIINATVVQQARERVAQGLSYAGVSTKPLIDSGQMSNSVGWDIS